MPKALASAPKVRFRRVVLTCSATKGNKTYQMQVELHPTDDPEEVLAHLDHRLTKFIKQRTEI